MQINIPQLRELMAQYIDLYIDEVLNLQGGTQEDVAQILAIVAHFKNTRFLAFSNKSDFREWYRKSIDSTSKLTHFSPFLERGYEFIMMHFNNLYGEDHFGSLVDTCARSLQSAFVAMDTAEERQPLNQRMNAADWVAIIQSFPWLIVVVLIRNTYIDFGEPDKDDSNNDQS